MTATGVLAAQVGLSYERFVVGLGVDLVAIVLLAYAIFFRRHRRRELLLAYVGCNVAFFVVVTALASRDSATGLAVGIGLFGTLAIIRLRSQELSYTEVAYFFSALALALVNGVGFDDHLFPALLSGLVVGAMFVMDHMEPHRRVQRMNLILDEIYSDETALRAELERRIGAEIVTVTINQIDYVRDVTRLEAQYIPRRRRRPQDKASLLDELEEGIGVDR